MKSILLAFALIIQSGNTFACSGIRIKTFTEYVAGDPVQIENQYREADGTISSEVLEDDGFVSLLTLLALTRTKYLKELEQNDDPRALNFDPNANFSDPGEMFRISIHNNVARLRRYYAGLQFFYVNSNNQCKAENEIFLKLCQMMLGVEKQFQENPITWSDIREFSELVRFIDNQRTDEDGNCVNRDDHGSNEEGSCAGFRHLYAGKRTKENNEGEEIDAKEFKTEGIEDISEAFDPFDFVGFKREYFALEASPSSNALFEKDILTQRDCVHVRHHRDQGFLEKMKNAKSIIEKEKSRELPRVIAPSS